MPIPKLNAMLAEMPVLRAQESLRRVTEYAIGTGSLKKQAARRVVREWQREARSGQPQRIYRPQSKSEMQTVLASVGIAWGG